MTRRQNAKNSAKRLPDRFFPRPVKHKSVRARGYPLLSWRAAQLLFLYRPHETLHPWPPQPAISQVVSPLPGGRSEDPVCMQISGASMSAARVRPVETEAEKCTETALSETSVCEPKAFERTDGKTITAKPLTSRVHPQLQNKRLREPSADHDTEQHVVEGSPRAPDDPEYCPSTCDALETNSDRHFGDKYQPPRKRHRSRSVSTKTKSQIQESNQRESAGLDRGSQLISAMSDDAQNMGEPINAAFDEWILQDVVLQRTIMDGKATFLFQFDRDLCMKHGAETGREGSTKQSRVKTIVKSNKRSCRKPRGETKGRRCRSCGLAGHNARTCQISIEPSDDEEKYYSAQTLCCYNSPALKIPVLPENDIKR